MATRWPKVTHRRHGRRKPYTVLGVPRLPCFRCGEKSRFQWSVCADGNLFRPLCEDCDIALNTLVLEWMGDYDREAKMAAYTLKVKGKPVDKVTDTMLPSS